ncbi:MAG: hypothetical protein WAS27_02130 [Candidatus Saccharimonadales bacterium]
MNTKKIITLTTVVAFIASLLGVYQAVPVSALVCPSGQVLHSSDNMCWIETAPTSKVGDRECTSSANGNSTTCTTVKDPCPPNSGVYSSNNGKCNKYAGMPKNNDGSNIDSSKVKCADGKWYHSSDNKCYTPEYNKITGQTEAQCKAWNAQKGYSGDNLGARHWDNGTCWSVRGHKDASDPAGYTYNKAEAIKTPEGCKQAGGKWDAQAKACKDVPENNSNTNASGNDNDNDPGSTSGGYSSTTKDCGGAKTNLLACKGEGVEAIADVLKIVLGVLTAIVGIVAVGGIAYASVLYASAEDNAGNVSKAKGIIRDVAIGLVLYGFLVAIVNWLVPGGIVG